MIGETIFWVGFAALAYAYAAYPLLLRTLAPVLRYRPRRGPLGLSISMVVAAHNEESVIEEKLRNFLALEYPGPAELLVVSDASTDETDEIVSRCGDPRVILLRQEPQAGKTAAMNRAVAEAGGAVLIFSDANSIFREDALVRLYTATTG